MQTKRQKAIQIKYKNKTLKVQSIVFKKTPLDIPIKDFPRKKNQSFPFLNKFGIEEVNTRYWNKTNTKAWIKKHNYQIKKIDETPDTYRFRQANPRHFIQSTYRTKNIGNGISLILAKPEKRNYKREYGKFQKTKKAKKYRAELNRYNHKKGTYGNGDGLDASHKNGKIVGFEQSHKNKGRKEKSRLKNEI